MNNLKLGTYIIVGLTILCIVFASLAFNKNESQGVFSEQDLQAMSEIDTNNVTILTLREKNKLLILTVGEKNLPDKLLNPTKYYECTYDGCTSLLASGATLINPTSGNNSFE